MHSQIFKMKFGHSQVKHVASASMRLQMSKTHMKTSIYLYTCKILQTIQFIKISDRFTSCL